MKYKLKKDLPGIKAGEIFKNVSNDNYEVNLCLSVTHEDRFEEIKERKISYPEPEKFASWCVINHFWNIIIDWEFWNEHDQKVFENAYILWNRFPTKEKAEAYIVLKKHVALFDIAEMKILIYEAEVEENGWHEYHLKNRTIELCWDDFIMPLDSTPEELAEREKLLRAFYDF